MRLVLPAVVAVVAALSLASARAGSGTLDPSFGRAGKVTTSFAKGGASAFDVAIQRDGRIVVAGSRDRGTQGDVTLARYRPNGRLDRTFGAGGKVSTSFGRSGVGGGSSLLIQPDGKIVVGGVAFDEATKIWSFGLVRYTRSGSLDRRFGTRGKVVTPFGRYAGVLALARQRDGKIVAAGFGERGNASEVALARYTARGVLDPTFGAGGKVERTVVPDSASARAIAIQRDGRIVVAGYRYEPNGFGGPVKGFLLLRLAPDGSPDSSFGAGGLVTTVVGKGGLAADVAVQPDGKIVAAGSTVGSFTDAGPPFFDQADFAVARYLLNGTLDRSFGSGGIVTSKLGPSSQADALALRRDGVIVVAGTAWLAHTVFALAAYRPDGSPDGRFWNHGIVRTGFEGGHAEAHAVVLQRNRVIAVGEAYGGGSNRLAFALARYRSPAR